MNNKKPDIDEKGNIISFDHLLIRDKETDEVILNKRDNKGKKICLTK
ncbi:MAG: hypothetical protein HC836_10805 [Richelia sp. RM2_1_2]|nr:hypothetical protein [Richelia sp. RM2_1_2]